MEASVTSAVRPGCETESVADDGKAAAATEEAMERAEPLDLAITPPADATDRSEHSPSDEKGEGLTPLSPEQAPLTRPVLSPVKNPTETSLGCQSLTEKVDQMRREQGIRPSQSNETPGATNAPTERAPSRKSGQNISPPITRAISHPIRTLPRTQSGIGIGKSLVLKEAKTNPPETTGAESQAEGSIKVDKKLSDRLGLSALKNRTKATTSSIPRFVHKKRETKVSTLARHFEQLSREFEKERIRDRKKRAASMRQPRAMLPRTTTKAIVEVYDDVNDAFEESTPHNEHGADREAEQGSSSKQSETVPKSEPQTEPPTPIETTFQSDDHHLKEEVDDAANMNTSQGFSDDEGGVSDLEHSLPEEYLPDIKEIADSLEPSTEIPLELPKHQKTSLMKYLTNFWAERSASGWMPLEYPVNPTDHIFVDSDIIVREDEPSSVVALALNSDDYQGKLGNIRREAQEGMQREVESGGDMDPKSFPTSDTADWMRDETELEKSLLRVTGTHLKYQFREGSATMTCKIFYAEQFDALRRKCGVAERIVESLSRCLKWDSRGGKTKSVFLKTLDDRLVLKSLSPIETSAFLRFAPGYFNIMAEALFHDLPSVIAKMLGFFQVFIKNPVTGTDIKLDLLVTENLFYDRSASRIFDLKGSMRNRKIQSTGEQNEVLLDENMVEYIYESPLFAREHSKKLLRASVWNDTLFLARQNVMDYSLMIAVDEARKELVVGIIDCIRTYTWDKKLESWIKDRGFAGGNRNRPTVTSPKEYKSRFREAMARRLTAGICSTILNILTTMGGLGSVVLQPRATVGDPYLGGSTVHIRHATLFRNYNLSHESQHTTPLSQTTSLDNLPMSIDLNWETLTSGPDGDALANRIRTFIHDKFQTVQLPRFIRSVTVHGFDFGTIPPELELKDITDPLPDFYDQDLDDDESDDEPEPEVAVVTERERPGLSERRRPGGLMMLRSEMGGYDMGSPFLGTSIPGFLGGSSLSYFPGHLGTGTHTPLAAVAGAHLGNSWMGTQLDAAHHASRSPSHSRNPSQSSIVSIENFASGLAAPQSLREKSSVSTLPATPTGTSRPPTRDTHLAGSAVVEDGDDDDDDEPAAGERPRREPRVEDVQAVFRIRYSGDIRLNLTAEILLDYPMPSFVGIPLKLNITGMSFDGVGVLAHIRKRVHFCFLSPEDALAAVGPDGDGDGQDEQGPTKHEHKTRLGGLLQEIKVESEIGERDGGKQSLKNVGKVERFVLEQVRRIFEEEFVYPSFWTFLV
ncbi:hypothetical protein G7046_g2777 [Stylonectria norvegica]|nr:hypothetical protein G7046_g2777 [Stylonectria norvegica]